MATTSSDTTDTATPKPAKAPKVQPGRYVANTPLTVGGTIAFAAGHDVPRDHPRFPRWLADESVTHIAE